MSDPFERLMAAIRHDIGDIGVSTDTPDAWKDAAACHGHSHLFIPTYDARWDLDVPPNGYEPARQICRTCPVFTECKTWIDANPQDIGFYAGMSPAQRDRQRYPRRKAA